MPLDQNSPRPRHLRRVHHERDVDPRAALVHRSRLLDRHAWDDLIRRRHLVPLTNVVARVADSAATPGMRAHALAEHCPPGAVIGDTSAAWIRYADIGSKLAGLIPKDASIKHWREIHRGPVTCLYPAARPRPIVRSTMDCSLRQTRFRAGDLQQVKSSLGKPLLVTSPERTVLDLLCVVRGSAIFAALSAFQNDGVDLNAVAQRLESMQRWRGRLQGIATLEAFRYWNG